MNCHNSHRSRRDQLFFGNCICRRVLLFAHPSPPSLFTFDLWWSFNWIWLINIVSSIAAAGLERNGGFICLTQLTWSSFLPFSMGFSTHPLSRRFWMVRFHMAHFVSMCLVRIRNVNSRWFGRMMKLLKNIYSTTCRSDNLALGVFIFHSPHQERTEAFWSEIKEEKIALPLFLQDEAPTYATDAWKDRLYSQSNKRPWLHFSAVNPVGIAKHHTCALCAVGVRLCVFRNCVRDGVRCRPIRTGFVCVVAEATGKSPAFSLCKTSASGELVSKRLRQSDDGIVSGLPVAGICASHLVKGFLEFFFVWCACLGGYGCVSLYRFVCCWRGTIQEANTGLRLCWIMSWKKGWPGATRTRTAFWGWKTAHPKGSGTSSFLCLRSRYSDGPFLEIFTHRKKKVTRQT